MKLTIFGATGEAGRQLLEKAFAEGNEVTAFVRIRQLIWMDRKWV